MAAAAAAAPAEDGPRTIAVAVDGSVGSELAFRTLVDRFVRAEDHVLLVSVFEPQSVLNTGSLLQAHGGTLRALGVAFETVQLEGDPAQGLLETVEEQGVELLLMGAKGSGKTLERVGTTALACTRYAGCSVLLMRE